MNMAAARTATPLLTTTLAIAAAAAAIMVGFSRHGASSAQAQQPAAYAVATAGQGDPGGATPRPG
jgi:hypothetical protein